MNPYWIITIRYLCIISIGVLCRRCNILKADDRSVLSRLILYITLPSVIISSFEQAIITFWHGLCLLFGLLFNIFLLALSTFISKKETPQDRAMFAICSTGYNLGNVTIPFLQAVIPSGIPYLGFFDTGDSLITFGGTYTSAKIILNKNGVPTLKEILKTLASSAPFVTYVVMSVITLLGIRLPSPVLEFFSVVGNCNVVLAMLLIGISLDFMPGKVRYDLAAKLLVFRFIMASIFSSSVFFLIPSAPLIMRQTLAISMFSAITNVCLVYVGEMGLDSATASFASTISTLTAIPILTIVAGVVLHP